MLINTTNIQSNTQPSIRTTNQYQQQRLVMSTIGLTINHMLAGVITNWLIFYYVWIANTVPYLCYQIAVL